MYDAFTVYKLKPVANASSEKPYLLLGKLVLFTNMVSEISSWHEVHNKIKSFPILKGLSHVDEEFMFEMSKKFPLISN